MKIYHYTDANGLIGILNKRTLWSTNIKFLNDSQEYEYGLLLRKKLFSLDESSLLEERRHFGENIYVTCFSEFEDKLSQWRGYANNGLGYCIGFDSDKLGEVLRKPDYIYQFDKVYYEENDVLKYLKDRPDSIRLEIEQEAKEILENSRLIQENMQKDPEESEYNFAERKSQIGTGYSQQVRIGLGLKEAHMGHGILAFCKHEGFSEENEYRIVIKLRNHSMIKYRPRNGIVIPYLELELPKDLSSIITEIYFGPGLNKNLARSGLTELLSNSGFSGEKINDLIREPNVPYRV